MGKASPSGRPPQRVRIIAGDWRGRFLQVPPGPTVRPTPARIRETVFNWLMPHIAGARCVDLFAGSGALGFEAASRGAAHVTLIDHNRAVTRCLQQQARTLAATNIEVVHAAVSDWLDGPLEPHDILFLDPPFAAGAGLLEKTCTRLDASSALSQSSLVYVESPAGQAPSVPAHWTALKSKQAGRVGYHLFAAGPVLQ